jgi:hypothetical protein
VTTGEPPIVEDSRRDDFWGAVAAKEDPEVLVGCNVLGCLLIELRDLVRDRADEKWSEVIPAKVPEFFLYGNPIGTIAAAPDVLRSARSRPSPR